ncbi:hypothetical protein [Nocardiopsis lucentensis]|uniref:hypothetical protein n=1 Tax=Nocardiopsis lucentensis TaxID=53441 RepID=UPI0003482F6E|nr:hypothetical protein [Nocardiopsis lucentensis]
MDTCGRDTCNQPTALTITGSDVWGLPMGRLRMHCCADHEPDMLHTLRDVFGIGLDDNRITATRHETAPKAAL